MHFHPSLKRSKILPDMNGSGFEPEVRVPSWIFLDISGCTRKHLTSIKTKHSKRLKLEQALILVLTKIRPQIEVMAYKKENLSSH
jgi:hypothetical protein